MSNTPPTVRLRKGRIKPIASGHPWVFSGSVQEILGSPGKGEVVRVTGPDGRFLGTGTFNPESDLLVRILRRTDAPIDTSFFSERFQAARTLREAQIDPDQTNAYRTVHSEGDGLSGLIVDRFASHLVVQVVSAGMERLREVWLPALLEVFEPLSVVERTESFGRSKEGLPYREAGLHGDSPDEPIPFRENGLDFLADLKRGQKTGFYLDQRENRARLARFSAGRKILDAFAYTGAFSKTLLSLGTATSTTAIESSAPAIELGKKIVGDLPVEWTLGDALKVLPVLAKAGHRFGGILLDPPGWAPPGGDPKKAISRYERLLTEALPVTEPGGWIAVFSCSQRIGEVEMLRAIARVTARQDLNAKALATFGPGLDHPYPPACPEARYLSGVLFQVS